MCMFTLPTFDQNKRLCNPTKDLNRSNLLTTDDLMAGIEGNLVTLERLLDGVWCAEDNVEFFEGALAGFGEDEVED